MRVILFQPRFASLVLTETKLQTIRKCARCQPGDVLSLREWTGKPRRSKQWEIHRRICKDVKKVRMCFARDGKFLIEVDGREVRSREWFAHNDGFKSFDDMVQWFLATHGMEEFNGELITWHKGKSPPEPENPNSNPADLHRAFEWPVSKRFGYVLATLRADHAHWLNDYDTDPTHSETCLNELEDAARALGFFKPQLESEVEK